MRAKFRKSENKRMCPGSKFTYFREDFNDKGASSMWMRLKEGQVVEVDLDAWFEGDKVFLHRDEFEADKMSYFCEKTGLESESEPKAERTFKKKEGVVNG